MSRITVLGGSGYAGSHIVQQAVERGHQVTAVSRSLPAEPHSGAQYRSADATDEAVLRELAAQSDVIIAALSPRGDLAAPGVLREVYRSLAKIASETHTRLGVIGGAGSLHVSEGGPLLVDTADFPAEFFAEAHQLADVLSDLRADQSGLSWFFVSPALQFGAYAPGESLGTYRVGGDVVLVDEAGESRISGQDFGLAIVDEIEHRAHENTRFAVAY